MKKLALKLKIIITNISRIIMSFLFINLNFSLNNKALGASIKNMDVTCYDTFPAEQSETFTFKNVLIILVPVAIIIGTIILIVKRKKKKSKEEKTDVKKG